MNTFDKYWREKVVRNTEKEVSKTVSCKLIDNGNTDMVDYTQKLISTLRNETIDEKIKNIFIKSACHLPHDKLISSKKVYEETKSLSKTIKQLESDYKIDIKKYKNLSDEQVDEIINLGWGLAGILKGDEIIATKIPSQFHEYFAETSPRKKKYFYCHCPRVKSVLLSTKKIDSIYCNCGGGFYVDVWEHITGKDVKIEPLTTLFDGHDLCSFKISFID